MSQKRLVASWVLIGAAAPRPLAIAPAVCLGLMREPSFKRHLLAAKRVKHEALDQT